MLVMMRLLCLASEHNVATEAFLNGPLRPKTRKTYRRRNFLNRKKDIHLNDELVKRNMFYCRSWQRCNDIFSQSLESKHLGPRKMIMWWCGAKSIWLKSDVLCMSDCLRIKNKKHFTQSLVENSSQVQRSSDPGAWMANLDQLVIFIHIYFQTHFKKKVCSSTYVCNFLFYM